MTDIPPDSHDPAPAPATDNHLLAGWLHAACWLEASARKPGNVHPQASFPDLCYADLIRAAEVAAPILAASRQLGVGPAIYQAVEQSQAVAATNVNLGIVLLLAPLAAVPYEVSLAIGLGGVLTDLTQEDAAWAYRAIRLANPGGLGTVADQDVAAEPTVTLRDAMRLAARHDTIAAQYVNVFSQVLDFGLDRIRGGNRFEADWEIAVIELQLRILANIPDSHIARKCGQVVAMEASRRAHAVLHGGWPQSARGQQEFQEFDAWLRADGHRRNPGTTADLVAACLFVAFREGVLVPPALVLP